MKPWKILTLLFIGIITFTAVSQLSSTFSPKPTQTNTKPRSPVALATAYNEGCLEPTLETRPTWECYEVSVDAPVHKTVTVEHDSGESYQVLTFQTNEQTKFRFTPTQQGTWTFSTGGEININADRPDYAQGFVEAKGNKWIRSATGKAFVPQFVMYNKLDLDEGLDEFVDGHGFTGFHIRTLRDFLDTPDYFEAAVLKTYRRGGVTHFWIWGDKARGTTPSTYGVDVDELYTEIAARLSPIPGWTLGYGFDLFEWASAKELEDLRAKLREDSSYHHLIGGRGHKNQYREISTKLDYASWEWHHPSYQDYIEHFEQANDQRSDKRPVFSEDRFRIQTPDTPQHYTAEETLQGLWHSAIAGGIANIWGNRPAGQKFSEPYPNKTAIKTYSQFIKDNFTVTMEPDNSLISEGYCLRDTDKSGLCYSEQPDTVQFTLDKFTSPITAITAVDTKTSYEEIQVPITTDTTTINWQPPYPSDWAFHIVGSSEDA